ncbi:MAG: M10 family metallopeptidase C-terminal domain-containing protein, partial [Rhodocyclaceae bacterium]|nr:M10 family metallopeptidase C-terminal domain-containing protein [Rhodocyclaceae bacterium]
LGVSAADYASALVITGNEGDNYIVGTAGNDTISGGGGNDAFSVTGARTAGLDFLDGGDGYDQILYFPTEDGETLAPAGLSGVEMLGMGDSPYAEGAAVAANFSAAASTNAMAIFGNAADNALNGSRFDDSIDGKAGNDSLIGGAGKDLLEGGIGNDVLAGGSGNDTLDGGAGNDILVGNAGDDVFLDMQTTDVAIGGRGTDVLRFTGAGLNLNLTDFSSTSVEGVDITGSGDNTLWNLDLAYIDLLGGPAPLTWTLDGDAGDRVQIGGDESVMPGASDGYTLYVGTHSTVRIDQDIIIFHLVAGSTENENLSGGAGNDYIFGGGGADTLVAGAGNDTLSGGAGNDVFRLAAQTAYPSSSPDTIENFSSGIDRIELAALSFGPLPPGGDVGAHFNSGPGAVFTSVSDYFVYDTTAGELYYSPVGSAAAPALIATLTGHPILLASDISMV